MDIKKRVLVKITKPFMNLAPNDIVEVIISDNNKYYTKTGAMIRLHEISEENFKLDF